MSVDLVVIDNYDSFVHNLARYLRLAGATTRILRNDAPEVDDVLVDPPDGLVLSPGPGRPEAAGKCLSLLTDAAANLPVLGICLGHQCLGAAAGGEVPEGPPVHGMASSIRHDGQGLFVGCDNPMPVGRYHSLCVRGGDFERQYHVAARTDDDVVMAIRHRDRPWYGLQFHPESVLSPQGQRLIDHFVQKVCCPT